MRVTLYIFSALSAALDLTLLFIPFIHAFATPRWCFIKMHLRKLGNRTRIGLSPCTFAFIRLLKGNGDVTDIMEKKEMYKGVKEKKKDTLVWYFRSRGNGIDPACNAGSYTKPITRASFVIETR